MIRVRPEGMPNGGPTASLAITPITGESMLTITLDATGSTDPDQDMMHTVWDFGDGIKVDTYSEKRTFHTYSRPGTYDVTVTVIDVFGETSTSTPITVTVTGTDPQPTTGVVTTGTATTAPATTGAATGSATTAPATTGVDTTGVDTTGAGPVTTTGPAGTTTGASTDAGTTDATPSTTESVSTEGSTSGPSSTESATTEAVTTGEELTTGEVPNETSAGVTEGAEVSSTTGTKKSSATTVAVSFVSVSIAVVFAVLL